MEKIDRIVRDTEKKVKALEFSKKIEEHFDGKLSNFVLGEFRNGKEDPMIYFLGAIGYLAREMCGVVSYLLKLKEDIKKEDPEDVEDHIKYLDCILTSCLTSHLGNAINLCHKNEKIAGMEDYKKCFDIDYVNEHKMPEDLS